MVSRAGGATELDHDEATRLEARGPFGPRQRDAPRNARAVWITTNAKRLEARGPFGPRQHDTPRNALIATGARGFRGFRVGGPEPCPDPSYRWAAALVIARRLAQCHGLLAARPPRALEHRLYARPGPGHAPHREPYFACHALRGVSRFSDPNHSGVPCFSDPNRPRASRCRGADHPRRSGPPSPKPRSTPRAPFACRAFRGVSCFRDPNGPRASRHVVFP